MKLYTEEQVIRIAKLYRHELYLLEAAINTEKPIEIPTDEEIKKMALEKYRDVEYTRGDEMIQFGAKWVIKQIKKQK